MASFLCYERFETKICSQVQILNWLNLAYFYAPHFIFTHKILRKDLSESLYETEIGQAYHFQPCKSKANRVLHDIREILCNFHLSCGLDTSRPMFFDSLMY